MTLRPETLQLEGVLLKPDNPLAPLKRLAASRAGLQEATFPADAWRSLEFGELGTLLPYSEQNGYDRDRRPVPVPAVVLENEHLVATVLPSLGGRVWSLLHKPSGRQLFYENPVLQPANLAVRSAWFAGGLEWNIGVIGHSPHTMSPLYYGTYRLPDGREVLRLYEYERLRGLVYGVDLWLQDEELRCGVVVENPNSEPTPMYWWSNLAVPETVGTRVFSPATEAVKIDYEGRYLLVPLDLEGDADTSFPLNSVDANDYFFVVPEGALPWVGAFGPDGHGVYQASTARLRGRKLFMWGSNLGGRRWQEFLSGPGGTYAEIQGGLGRTQLEYLTMSPNTTWTWLEAYGPATADPDLIGGGWRDAHQAACSAVDDRVSLAGLDRDHDEWLRASAGVPVRLWAFGSGWGALEEERRRISGDRPLSTRFEFPREAIGSEERPYERLLATGVFGGGAGILTGAQWRPLLFSAATPTREAEAERLLHLGLLDHAALDPVAARSAWEESLRAAPNRNAARNLAVLHLDAGDTASAVSNYRLAWSLGEPERNLAVELAAALFKAAGMSASETDFSACDEFLSSLPSAIAEDGRVRVMRARVALRLNRLEEALRLLGPDLVVPDIREGEALLELAWNEAAVHQLARELGSAPEPQLLPAALDRWPLPPHLDFRMHRRPVPFDTPLVPDPDPMGPSASKEREWTA